ncbi:unnamed protein product [Dimorphilus gyrociliatus]|uniref:Glycosyltransferase 61 catalytic domain-containing protein n=1 Tax=Dimorphilus gyrociliatus TaxID=2664684 RepID=A0A7I8VTY4_9ANNE|nr:unnamed protein product [Dimorphilus gyrociliatus]
MDIRTTKAQHLDPNWNILSPLINDRTDFEKQKSHDNVYYNLYDFYMGIRKYKTEEMPLMTLYYENFKRKEPLFPSDEDRTLFFKSERNKGNFVPNTKEQLKGVIQVVKNATFKMFYDCGFRSNVEYFSETRRANRHYRILAPMIIPMGYLFQHFYDGTLPKLVQAWEILRRPEVTVLLERPFHKNIFLLLTKFNITNERIVWHRRSDYVTVYSADYLIFACIAPPLHPVLWKQGRRFLGVPDRITVPKNEATIMLLTRAGAVNPGRRIHNKRNVIDYLASRYKERLIVFDAKYNLEEAIKVFSKTSIIIGTHGGALYNMNYASLDVAVIEYVPVTKTGYDIPALPHAIFWAISDLTGQKYWRVQAYPANHVNDMVIDIPKLTKMLDIIDPETKNSVNKHNEDNLLIN